MIKIWVAEYFFEQGFIQLPEPFILSVPPSGFIVLFVLQFDLHFIHHLLFSFG
jgi:hypothetical protein